MANMVGPVFKAYILDGQTFNGGGPIDLITPPGTAQIDCTLSTAARATALYTTATTPNASSGRLKSTEMTPIGSVTWPWDANDVVHTAVSGSECLYIAVEYNGDGVNGAAIVIIDTATGLPFTPSGGDVTIVWDNGANKIFLL